MPRGDPVRHGPTHAVGCSGNIAGRVHPCDRRQLGGVGADDRTERSFRRARSRAVPPRAVHYASAERGRERTTAAMRPSASRKPDSVPPRRGGRPRGRVRSRHCGVRAGRMSPRQACPRRSGRAWSVPFRDQQRLMRDRGDTANTPSLPSATRSRGSRDSEGRSCPIAPSAKPWISGSTSIRRRRGRGGPRPRVWPLARVTVSPARRGYRPPAPPRWSPAGRRRAGLVPAPASSAGRCRPGRGNHGRPPRSGCAGCLRRPRRPSVARGNVDGRRQAGRSCLPRRSRQTAWACSRVRVPPRAARRAWKSALSAARVTRCRSARAAPLSASRKPSSKAAFTRLARRGSR